MQAGARNAVTMFRLQPHVKQLQVLMLELVMQAASMMQPPHTGPLQGVEYRVQRHHTLVELEGMPSTSPLHARVSVIGYRSWGGRQCIRSHNMNAS